MKPEDLKDCSDAELNLKLAELLGTADRYLIKKRNVYYRVGGGGYTCHQFNAWVQPKAEALKHEYKKGTPDEWVTIEQASVPCYAFSAALCRDVEATLKAEEHTDVTDSGSYYSQQMRYACHLAALVVNWEERVGGAVPYARLFPFMHAEPRKRVIALICTLTPHHEAA